MKITFLGTGAAEGVPAMFCSCDFCSRMRKEHPNEYRARSQVLIDDILSVDFPPEAYVNSMRFGVDLSALEYVLVTHSHMDHFYAHDFILHGYKYATLKCKTLKIYGNAEVEKVFCECTAREMREEVAASIIFNRVEAYDVVSFGDYKVISLPARHKTKEQALLYYVSKGGKGYLHLYDTGGLDGEAIKFLKDNAAFAGAVAFDCTFLDEAHAAEARHMGVDDCARIKDMLNSAGVTDGRTKFYITHFSHHSNPTEEKLASISKEYGFIAARDGLTIEI